MTLREWWVLARPPTLPASVAPVAVGVAAGALAGSVSWLLTGVMLAVALLLQIGTNMANEYADFRRGVDQADSVGIAGFLVTGHMTAPEIRRWAAGTFLAALLLGMVLVAARGLWLLGLGALGASAAGLYNAGPRPLSATPFGEAVVFLIMGPIEVVASELAAVGRFTPAGVLASLAVGCTVASILMANNLRDRLPDRDRGRRTVAVLLGPRAAQRGLEALVAVGLLLPLLFGAASLLPITAGGPALLLPWAWARLRTLARPEGLAKSVLVAGRIHLWSGLLLALGLAAGVWVR
ncbi:MAG: 1,4-dihydroxy-2-naphthoate octaprenyltransferase [Thermaerobacter sp.]|nr:1,4-dihydroxy-2-naphthoate octaprenyltransferase [Thermaerobacter sp.]